MGDQPFVGCFGVEIIGILGNNERGETGAHIDGNVIHLMTQVCVINNISVFKSKIVGAAFMGFPRVLVCFKGFVVAISNFKHF